MRGPLRRLIDWSMARLAPPTPPPAPKLEKVPNWPPEGYPETFGYATLAKPRKDVQQDAQLIEDVGEIVSGVVKPGKKVKTSCFLIEYEDGDVQTVCQHDGPVRVFVENDGNGNYLVTVCRDLLGDPQHSYYSDAKVLVYKVT